MAGGLTERGAYYKIGPPKGRLIGGGGGGVNRPFTVIPNNLHMITE